MEPDVASSPGPWIAWRDCSGCGMWVSTELSEEYCIARSDVLSSLRASDLTYQTRHCVWYCGIREDYVTQQVWYVRGRCSNGLPPYKRKTPAVSADHVTTKQTTSGFLQWPEIG